MKECKSCKELKEKVEANWKEREEDDKYWSGIVEEKEVIIKEKNKKISSLKGQIKLAIERKNWWKSRASQIKSSKKVRK